MPMRDPDRRKEQRTQDTDDDLDRLPPDQRAQSSLQLVQPAIAKELYIERVLLLQPVIQHLPGLLEFVQFHAYALVK
jgi:hypothetical protein